MAGIGGFSAAPPNFWCTLRGVQRDTQRAVTQSFNLAMLMAAFAIYLASGSILRSTAPLVGLVAVAVALPVMLGARLCIGISEAMGCWCWLNSAEPVAEGCTWPRCRTMSRRPSSPGCTVAMVCE
jgi:hypothetical protein